jgi:HEAT repeat protein
MEKLAKIDDPRVAEAIFAVYNEPEDKWDSYYKHVKPKAAAILEKIGDPRAADFLISLL